MRSVLYLILLAGTISLVLYGVFPFPFFSCHQSESSGSAILLESDTECLMLIDHKKKSELLHKLQGFPAEFKIVSGGFRITFYDDNGIVQIRLQSGGYNGIILRKDSMFNVYFPDRIDIKEIVSSSVPCFYFTAECHTSNEIQLLEAVAESGLVAVENEFNFMEYELINSGKAGLDVRKKMYRIYYLEEATAEKCRNMLMKFI